MSPHYLVSYKSTTMQHSSFKAKTCFLKYFTYLYIFFCLCLLISSLTSLAFGQCFSKVLFVCKEFCDYESGMLNFWQSPEMWPPHSPDLNPVDYAVWGALQQMVYQRRWFTTIKQLNQAIVIEWGKLSQRFIDRAIGHWRRRLECIIQQQGGHIEHLM